MTVEFIALVWCMVYSYRGDGVRLDLEGIRWFSADVLRDMLRISLPMLGSSLAWGLGFSMHSFIMGHSGSDAAAAAFFVLSETARQYLIIMLVFSGAYVFAYSVNTIIVCGIFPAGGDAGYDAASVFFASWCFAIPLALLGAFVFRWPVTAVYIIMCSDEIVKLPWLYPRYKKYIWLKNLTRESGNGNERSV